jgi:hypothetical protein
MMCTKKGSEGAELESQDREGPTFFLFRVGFGMGPLVGGLWCSVQCAREVCCDCKDAMD